ncbi:MAG: hypothetical protein HY718_06165 [Planctomycetes bacterium]|nr:hypothetical protein [Planctomycetota bacterium]
MRLSLDEERFLRERRREIRRELGDLQRRRPQPRYHDLNEHRVDLLDELTRIDAELLAARTE